MPAGREIFVPPDPYKAKALINAKKRGVNITVVLDRS
jgi:hypothetical protein